ncbi:MAG TPA: hypothetical protein VFQ22_11510 [Longimicrobiales bacterium]|nr:hypothetical protein [Longimicrobiales bacterium]
MKKALVALAALALVWAAPASGQAPNTSFFITSAGPGFGADLGGLSGADAHCQDLAYTAGLGDKTWRAYLSTVARNGQPAVNARDRIGTGPWYNFNGDLIARDVTELHSPNANLTKETILTERGQMVNGRDDDPNQHDVLTGSNPDGTVFTGEGHDACGNWTSSDEGSARVGHHDRQGGGDNPTSWNSAHNSRGCSQEDLVATGGNGYFYCFAIDGNQPPGQQEEQE